MEIYTVLGERITITKLSQKLKVEEVYLTKVLSRNRKPSVPLTKKLCKNIKITFSYFRPDLVPEDWEVKIQKDFWVFRKNKNSVYSFVGFFEKKENNIVFFRPSKTSKTLKEIKFNEIFCIVPEKQGDILKNKKVGTV